jgi:hypothetical protein
MPVMTRSRAIALVILGHVLAFLIGFLPPWSRTRTLSRELAETRHELALARLEGQLGAALAESQRSNYERARQLMTGFFSGAQQRLPQVTDAERHQALQQILAQRDEIITLLSRAEPESTQRLMLLYTRYFAAIDPVGREAPTALTPSTP